MASGLPPPLTLAALGSVTAPTLVLQGEHTVPYFALTNTVVLRCIPGSVHVIIPEATHLMSYQNPSAFNAALLRFLADH
jgi:pimeloyl-ACP methyl ester carboxylesterase